MMQIEVRYVANDDHYFFDYKDKEYGEYTTFCVRRENIECLLSAVKLAADHGGLPASFKACLSVDYDQEEPGKSRQY